MVNKDVLEENINILCVEIAHGNFSGDPFNCQNLECEKCPFNNVRSFMNWFKDYKEEHVI